MSNKVSNSFTKFSTLEGANAGVKMLVKDANGKETTEWVTVLGSDSEQFQRASKRMRVDTLAFLELKGDSVRGTDEHADFVITQSRLMRASLVKAWSFDEPCTPENVLEMFKHAPYIAEQIDETGSKRALFVKV